MRKNSQVIQVFEWDSLRVDSNYEGVEFKSKHLRALGQYAEKETDCPFFQTYFSKVRFNQFVGVIKVGDLIIEVLPKTDRGTEDKSVWQKVLLEMLWVSLQVEAKTTSSAHINTRHHSVLEAYLQLFLDEAERLIHRGLIRKYRTVTGNRTALKGKLLVHQHIIRNVVHAERFFVAHSVYNRNNVYNYILQAALECIVRLGSDPIRHQAEALLLFFPDCTPVAIHQKLFDTLRYDRKTDSYRRAIELARIILLNYHPDLQTGKNDILAIMFDMNKLWEHYVLWALKKASRDDPDIHIEGQQSRRFWKKETGNPLTLKPDILIRQGDEIMVLDTKWKYESKTSIEDVRQLYAYGKYFHASENYLVYPATLGHDTVQIQKGDYFKPGDPDINHSEQSCGLVFVDLLEGGKLNKGVGGEVLEGIWPEVKA